MGRRGYDSWRNRRDIHSETWSMSHGETWRYDSWRDQGYDSWKARDMNMEKQGGYS